MATEKVFNTFRNGQGLLGYVYDRTISTAEYEEGDEEREEEDVFCDRKRFYALRFVGFWPKNVFKHFR